eukprot:8322498-Alexandrium_andersonii.AAC.1
MVRVLKMPTSPGESPKSPMWRPDRQPWRGPSDLQLEIHTHTNGKKTGSDIYMYSSRKSPAGRAVSYTHLRAHETSAHL